MHVVLANKDEMKGDDDTCVPHRAHGSCCSLPLLAYGDASIRRSRSAAVSVSCQLQYLDTCLLI